MNNLSMSYVSSLKVQDPSSKGATLDSRNHRVTFEIPSPDKMNDGQANYNLMSTEDRLNILLNKHRMSPFFEDKRPMTATIATGVDAYKPESLDFVEPGCVYPIPIKLPPIEPLQEAMTKKILEKKVYPVDVSSQTDNFNQMINTSGDTSFSMERSKSKDILGLIGTIASVHKNELNSSSPPTIGTMYSGNNAGVGFNLVNNVGLLNFSNKTQEHSKNLSSKVIPPPKPDLIKPHVMKYFIARHHSLKGNTTKPIIVNGNIMKLGQNNVEVHTEMTGIEPDSTPSKNLYGKSKSLGNKSQNQGNDITKAGTEKDRDPRETPTSQNSDVSYIFSPSRPSLSSIPQNQTPTDATPGKRNFSKPGSSAGASYPMSTKYSDSNVDSWKSAAKASSRPSCRNQVLTLQKKLLKLKEIGIPLTRKAFTQVRKMARMKIPPRICLCHCRYDIVRDVCAYFDVVEVPEGDDWNIIWTDYICQYSYPKRLRPFQISNHFPGMYNIYRKDMLAKNLNRMRKQFGEDYNIFPDTWVLPMDYHELQKYTDKFTGKSFICKPETGCQGKGITLVKAFRDINPFWRAICQVYINRPLLIDGLKFDLRLYVLVTCCNPLRVYLHKEGLARFATEKYRQPSKHNTTNAFMHLTNYSLNKKNQGFINDAEKGNKRRVETVLELLRQQGCDIEGIRQSIKDVIIKTLVMVAPTLQSEYEFTYHWHHKGLHACFEILGFDIILDSRYKPYVLEVNHSPSFHTDSDLDVTVKQAVVHDTFAMLNIKRLSDHFHEHERREWLNSFHYRRSWGHEFGSSKQDDSMICRSSKNYSHSLQKHLCNFPQLDLEGDDEQFKWEIQNSGGFELLYPTKHTGVYDKYFEFAMKYEMSGCSFTDKSQAISCLRKTLAAQRKLVHLFTNTPLGNKKPDNQVTASST